MKKRGDISQVFVYIMSAIVMVAVLGMGAKWIMNLMSIGQEVKCLEFKKDLEQRLYQDRSYGVVDTDPLKVDCSFRKICFVDLARSGETGDPIIDDSWSTAAKQNVFFVNAIAEDFYYIDDLEVDGEYGFICADVVDKRVSLKFKGMGDKTQIALPGPS